jgi:hypothetical protein
VTAVPIAKIITSALLGLRKAFPEIEFVCCFAVSIKESPSALM